MKKNYVFALMSAIALTSAVSFTACSSDDAVVDNPNYDATTGEVKTAFTLSVGSVAGTRMTADAVQKDQSFLGMTDIYLFPFKEAVASGNTISESYIHLADFDGFDQSVEKAHGKIYKDVNLSVGVNNFLFYGTIVSSKAGNGKLKASYLPMTDENWKTGYTSWAPSPILKGSSKVEDLKFDLVPIRRGWAIADVQANEKAMATIKPLNAADAAITAAITSATTASAAAVVTELTKIQKVLRNEDDNVAGQYNSYAGSSNSIKSLMEMLYATLKNKETALTDGTNYATSIMTAIEADFNATANATTGEWTLAWITDPGFPANLGVPDGAAAVQYNATSAAFEYVTTSVDGLEVTAIDKYTYPARLYYRVNSPSMVKDAEYLSTNANATNDTWEKVKNAGGYVRDAVKASTRSVIIEDEVQYAVGRLDVRVRVKPETIINDNAKDAPQPVTVPSGGYKLTGVLIGGQKQVGWDFTPISTASPMTIWDNVMSGSNPIVAKQQDDYSEWNHTLALETAKDETVRIALEFENTGNDFSGVDHDLIPAGTKFYLVADLVPTPATTGYNATTLNSVFKQDYITKVSLTINENSLKSAYNVVPDLRSPKLEFGLSVNLEWQNGLVFEQEF